MLANKPNGECIYLTENGCSIHDNAPSMCRVADCRSISLKYNFETARKLHAINKIDIRIWDQGRKLLDEITSQEKNNG